MTNEVGKVSEATGVSVFNSQFTDYEGQQTGVQVKVLLNKAAATWRNNSSHKVQVNGYSSANDIATYRATINNNLTYSVTVSYDGDGFVNKITVN